MFPVYVDPNTESGSSRLRAFKLLTMGVAMLFAVGVAVLVSPALATESLLGLIVAVPVLLIGVSVLLLVLGRLQPNAPKSKRGVEGLDMYSMIDRMVEELDDDEAAYLQRRLDERDAKPKRDLTASLSDLLDQRAEDRQQR